MALNLQKTDLYSAKEAEFHFLINENKYIDSINIDHYLKNGIKKISSELTRNFKKHLKNNKAAKYSEKITKRYITTFSKLKSQQILKTLPTLFSEQPGIRKNLLYYLSSLGYSNRTAEIALQILEELKLHDDISLFGICNLITDWEIPITKDSDEFIKKSIMKITSFSIRRKKTFDFYCLLWIKTKYDHPDELYRFICNKDYIWSSSSFLRRQVTSIMARLLFFKKEKVTDFLNKQIATGEQNVVSVANTILSFSKKKRIEGKVNMYLFPRNATTFPLKKFLVLCSFLNSEVYRNDNNIRNNIINKIKDPYYRKWIECQYNIK